MEVFLVGVAFQVLAGTSAFLSSKHPRGATALGASGAVIGCILGLFQALSSLLGGIPASLQVNWDAFHGIFCVELDPLSAFFLAPVYVLSALAAIYGCHYMLAHDRGKCAGCFWFFFNLFTAGMELVLVSRTAFLFLAAWEVMSIAAYCLVTVDHEKVEVRQAGWIYLIATHVGVAFLLLAFGLLGRESGSTEFSSFRGVASSGTVWTGLIFVLALIGFGTKAGFVPFHVWLPEAHPAAPSPVSALMSGVMIKMGIYGLLRIVTFLGRPEPWWGPTLAGIGLATSLVGIALALHQRDMKRVLAYSSIENIGLIGLALGVGLWGWAGRSPAVAALGLTAGLLHVWNHTLMKGLMFLTAGSVLHATGTKDMERLGGLMKRMPWTAGAMTVGAVAMAALPPLNGFIGKWLIYLGLSQCAAESHRGASLIALLAIGLLALIGGLAAVAFVRLVGIVLLGSPRSEAADAAHESSPWMVCPILMLLVLCLVVAFLPGMVTRLIGPVVVETAGRDDGQIQAALDSVQASLHVIGTLDLWIILALVTAALALLALSRKSRQAQGTTWGCGYIRPAERMQYTGQSFAEMISERVLPRFLRPRTARTEPQGLFPAPSEFGSQSSDPVSDRIYRPCLRHWADRFARLRFLQQGKVHVYLVYIAVMVVLALAWASLRTWWRTS